MYTIEEKEGRKYFISSITKKGNYIDCGKFFKELKEYNDEICKEQGVEHLDRNYPSQKILNRFSGGYISPSMMKSYMTNPATCFIQAISPTVSSDYTEIGRSVHKCFEEFYNLDKKERDISKLDSILDEEIKKFDQESSRKQLQKYIDGYKNTMDYLDETKELDHKNLDCYCEYFIKKELSPLGVKIPLPVYCVADRIDIRDGDLYITDYKTGFMRSDKLTSLDGYLGSMIMYKWACEADFGVPVKGAYLYTPGLVQKSWPLDISMANQSRYLERVLTFCDKFKKEAVNHVYEYIPDAGYFTSEPLKKFQEIMKKPGVFEIPVRYDVTPEEIIEEEDDDNS